jgi:endonuclease/exonuclease/phosphatase family metal-dependent hydrolase
VKFLLDLRASLTLPVVLLGCAISAASCVQSSALVRSDVVTGPPAIAWFAPSIAADVSTLDRWRLSVGPPVFVTNATTATKEPIAHDRLLLVSWNTAMGAADVHRMLRDVRAQHGIETPVVLLLQEVFRAGPEVPSDVRPGAGFASKLLGLRDDGGRDEVEALAASLGMNLYYVPSMRNGAPGASDEDRGNAILTTLPLNELSAIELPFERQRRVAVGATIAGTNREGRPWRLRIVSAHLDNMVGLRRLWIAGSELARARQARGLVSLMQDDDPIVLGADLNTWFGFADQAYRDVKRAFPQTRVQDHRPTFRGLLRLDHVFYRLPDGWQADVRRTETRYGSDHYPLVAAIRIQ